MRGRRRVGLIYIGKRLLIDRFARILVESCLVGVNVCPSGELIIDNKLELTIDNKISKSKLHVSGHYE